MKLLSRKRWAFVAVLGGLLGAELYGPPVAFGQGDPVHQERTRKYVAELKTLDLDGLAKLLIQDEHYFYPGHSTVQLVPLNNFETALSNRAVDAFLAKLEALPAGEGLRRCKTYFDDFFFKEYEQTVLRALRAKEDPKAPKNNQSMLGNMEGMIGCIYSTSQLSNSAEVYLQLKKIKDFATPIYGRMEKNPVYEKGFKDNVARYLEPDSRCQLALLAGSFLKDPGVSEVRKQKVQELLKDCFPDTRELTAWDSEVGTFDFNAVRGAAADFSRGVRKVMIFNWFEPRGKVLKHYDTKYQEEIIKELYKLTAP